MYAVAAVGLVVYLVLFILSKKEAVIDRDKKKGKFGAFQIMGLYLYKRLEKWKTSFLFDSKVDKNLKRLYPGSASDKLRRDYYADKFAKSLMIGWVGILLGLILCYQAKQEEIVLDGVVSRGTYSDQSKEIVLVLGEEEEFPITVDTKRLTKGEAEELYEEFLTELSQVILGENSSLDQVSEDLLLVEELENYPFYVEWKSRSPEVMTSSGGIKEITKTEVLEMEATVTYFDMEWEHIFQIRVIPPTYTKEELRYLEIESMLEKANLDSAEEYYWNLPEEYEGELLEWKQKGSFGGLIVWICAILLAVAIFFLRDKDLQKEVDEYKEALKKDYPEILQKMILYFSAGMTIRGAFRKLADDYLAVGKKRPAMEEIVYVCRELQAGIPEAQAYENFGKRTGVQEYIRFCTLLQQNLKKGNNTLLQRLREEADKAVLERLQNSRKRSEEAVTKLLVPMVLMLLVVMIMIMIPAFSTTVF